MSDDLVPLRVGFPSHGGGSLPVWAARHLGIFARNGLDVGLTFMSGAVNTVEALLAREVQFVNMASPPIVEANLRLPDADLVYLASSRVCIAQQVVAVAGVERLEDLEGRRIGARISTADRFADLDSTLWRYILEQRGMDPSTDVEFVDVGTTHGDLVRALVAGDVDAGLVVPPYAIEAQRQGCHLLLDGRDVQIPYQLGGIIGRRSYATEHDDVTMRFVRSYVMGLSQVLDDVVLTRELVRRYSRIDDPDVAHQTAAFYQSVLSYPPFPSLEGLRTVIDQMAARVPEAASYKAEQVVDTTWIDRLDCDGTLEQLTPLGDPSGRTGVAGE